MGAMQAQDSRSIKWAVTMRTVKPSFSSFKEAYDSGEIVRTHLFRNTWQLLPGEDLGWMSSLYGQKAMSGIEGWMKATGVSISPKERGEVQEALCDILSLRKSSFREEISSELADRGILLSDNMLGHHLRMAEAKGLICSGDLHPSKNTYSLAGSKVKNPLDLKREEGLSVLAQRYFRSRGPATLEDFVWWSGLNVSDCRKGMASLGGRLSKWTHSGRDYYFMEEYLRKGFRRGEVLLVPAFDEYLIAYKSRDVVLHPEKAHHAHDKKGIFHHVVSLDGEIVGNWNPSAPDLKVTVFKEGIVLPEEALSKEISRYQYAKTH